MAAEVKDAPAPAPVVAPVVNLMDREANNWFRTMLNLQATDPLPPRLIEHYNVCKRALDRVAGGSRFTPQEWVLIAFHAGCFKGK